MNMENKWRFVSNQNSVITGINDAGIETFTAKALHSLVRETIQNSLDASLVNTANPVTVEFSEFTIAPERFPDSENFNDVIRKCIAGNPDEPAAQTFFINAEKLMKLPVRILRISDYNTFGLRGSDTCKKGTDWSRLVKESGSSNKGVNSGGSFGIGKSAIFACSDLRTVFYSSLDDGGLKSNIGAARLVSFEEEYEKWTTGIGYYSGDDKFVAINEMAALQPGYQRREPGTDIYIMGFSEYESFKQEIILAVLMNFFISIHKGKLIVKIQDDTIDENTIGGYIANLNPYDSNKDIAALVNYYHLLTSNDPTIKRIPLDSSEYGSEYGFKDRECTLYLREGDGLNRKVLMTRKTGMRLFEQDRFSSGIEFTGILMIEGAEMNRVFREMEVPSHDAWEPGRCKENPKFYQNAYTDLRRYLKNQVIKHYAVVPAKEVDAFGAGEFLASIIDNPGSEKNRDKNAFSQSLQKVTGKESKPAKKKTRPPIITEPVDPRESKKKDRRFNQGERKGTNKYIGMNIQPRVICLNPKQGVYRVKFIVPKKAKRGRLDFMFSGEQNDFDMMIKSAKLSESKTAAITAFSGKQLFIDNLSSGETVVADVTTDYFDYCMMEVEYYASKK